MIELVMSEFDKLVKQIKPNQKLYTVVEGYLEEVNDFYSYDDESWGYETLHFSYYSFDPIYGSNADVADLRLGNNILDLLMGNFGKPRVKRHKSGR